MSVEAQVRNAKLPQEALVAIAKGIDVLMTAIEARESAPAPDPWGAFTQADVPEPPTGQTAENLREDELTPERRAAVEAAIEQLQTTALTAEPEETLAIEAKIRLLKDELNGNQALQDQELGARAKVKVTNKAGDTEVDLPVVSEEWKEIRRKQAIEMNLSDDFGEESIEYYAKGGPLWLYYGNRDFVMGLPDNFRGRMVADVQHTSPTEAHEFARDVLKDSGTGVDVDSAIAAIEQIAAKL